MVIGAVSTEGHVHSWVQDGTANDEVVMNFLVELKAQTEREVIVIMDNAPSHKSKWMKLTTNTVPGLHVRYLPPYSPELNPAEKLWRHLKHVKLKHHQARTKHQLTELVKGHMHWIARDTKFLTAITHQFSHQGFSRGL
jgi:transposase